MKSKTLISLAAIMFLVAGLMGCDREPGADTESTDKAKTEWATSTEQNTDEIMETEATEESVEEESLSPEEKILEERRNTVVEYMYNMLTVLWRAETDVEYQLGTGYSLSIKAGRIYSGLPYTYGCGTKESFLEYAGEPNEKGVYTISEDLFGAVNGGTSEARVGNDCSSAVFVAWAQIGATVTGSAPEFMYEDYGFVKVGDYETKTRLNNAGRPRLESTVDICCLDNGRDVMYEAYAKLKKGDAVVSVPGTGNHVMMVTDVKIVYGEDGKVDGNRSFIKVIDQLRTKQVNEECYKSEELGETVYIIGYTEHGITFKMLCDKGYLPYTCKELIDPSPIPEPYVKDTETTYSLDNLFCGIISSNWAIDSVTISITDENGRVIQEATGRSARGSWHREGEKQREFDLQQFVNDAPGAILGEINIQLLEAGNYHCAVRCRLMGGQELTVRDFEFTK